MSRKLNEEKRLLPVTAGNIRNNHIYVRDHFDFFPSDCFGASRKQLNEGGSNIEIVLDGLGEVVKTDIARDAKTAKPRGILRGRSWVRRFFPNYNSMRGDTLVQVGFRLYRLSV